MKDIWYDITINSGIAVWFAVGIIVLGLSIYQFIVGSLPLVACGSCLVINTIISATCFTIAVICCWSVNKKQEVLNGRMGSDSK